MPGAHPQHNPHIINEPNRLTGRTGGTGAQAPINDPNPPSSTDPDLTPNPTPTPNSTPNPTPTPTPSSIPPTVILASANQEAAQLFKEGFRVTFGFDGQTTSTEGNSTSIRRAAGWGADRNTFTWKRFISLEDNYNPYGTELNPWSLKRWYQWGARRFHFHCPFGRVVDGKTQSRVYEVDQFLNAKDGLIINGVVQNSPCPWMVTDFVDVIQALTTGRRGKLDLATWNSWTTGSAAWFNPSDPIKVTVYIGSISDQPDTDTAYTAYVQRWETLFATDPRGAAARLKASVMPFIRANCSIGFDSVISAAGPVPGSNVSITKHSRELQRGWWQFWKWLETKIGKKRIYVESHPYKRGRGNNPYLNYNCIADDNWSSSLCCPYTTGSTGPHATSELGDIEFVRCIWSNSESSTPLIATIKNGQKTLERYSFLEVNDDVINVPSQFISNATEIRLSPATIDNFYWSPYYASIIAYHLLERQDVRGEPNPRSNITKQAILVPATLLQVIYRFQGSGNYYKQFALQFPTSAHFIAYLAGKITEKYQNRNSIYD